VANTHFRDTLELNSGCYRFTVKDSDDDGISFWANNDGGGYARLKKVQGGNFFTIEEDFGKYISQAFRFETDLVVVGEEYIENIPEPELVVFPNPTTGSTTISWGSTSVSHIDIVNTGGQLVRHYGVFGKQSLKTNNLNPGVYFINIIDNNNNKTTNKLLVK